MASRPRYSPRVFRPSESGALAVGDATSPNGALDSRRSANCAAQIMTSTMMKYTAIGQDIFDLATIAAALGDQASSRAGRGNKPTNRMIVAGGGALSCELGNEDSNEVSLFVAAGAGSLLRLAASNQGSRSSRASADNTLSNMPFRSSPIAANRNGSNE